jgi:hypothetical protein
MYVVSRLRQRREQSGNKFKVGYLLVIIGASDIRLRYICMSSSSTPHDISDIFITEHYCLFMRPIQLSVIIYLLYIVLSHR